MSDLEKTRKSWRGKFIRDTKVNEFGVVSDVHQVNTDIYLLAHFPSNPKQARKVFLTPRPDLECLLPHSSRSRYRPADRAEVIK